MTHLKHHNWVLVLFTSVRNSENTNDLSETCKVSQFLSAHHRISKSICRGCRVWAEAEGWVRLLHPGRHGAHAPHVHWGVRHELGRHRRHLREGGWVSMGGKMSCDNTDLVIVSAHRRGEGVSTAHSHAHAQSAIPASSEEVSHPRPLLLGLGG